MIDIIICGDEKEILNAIKNSIDKYCYQIKTHENICIYSQSEFSHKILNDSIVVFGNKFYAKICTGNFIAIFNSSNHYAVNILNKSGNIAISCGTSPKDTISTASIDDDRKVISLQRTIRSIDNEIIEPRDFYVKSRYPLYPSLATCAVLLLLGVVPEKGFEF